MPTYGVTPTGFVRKPLPETLADIEEAARGVFGEGVIQTAESPLGQLNGLMASIVTTAWDIAESTYQSYDPDQAEGVRLDQLGRIRILDRATDEVDADYRAAITNQGRARIDLADIERAALGVSGVTWAAAWVNDTDTTDANGMIAHSIALAALGGDNDELAAAIRPYMAAGVSVYGNVAVNVTIDGRCRTIPLLRPTPRPVTLALAVTVRADRNGCPPPAASAMAIAMVEELSGDNRPKNGEDVTLHMLRTALSCRFPNAEITSGTGALDDDGLGALPLVIDFDEIATFAAGDIAFTVTIL